MSRPLLRGGTLAACCFAVFPVAASACSACGCILTSDWVGEGLSGIPGLRADLRYDYIPQTDLRSGHTNLGGTALPADREIERSTYNHYVTAGLDWVMTPKWAIDVQLPLVIRPHDTVGEGDIEASHSRTKGIGDARVTLRWQGIGGPGITGLQLGLKLPSGGFSTRFNAGPQVGEAVDRGLQAGSGTTDLLTGFYHFGPLIEDFDWFAQASMDVPLNSRQDYRPGVSGLGSIGMHYTGWRGITPQLQFNLRLAAQDSGGNSDRGNSGGELLYVSPGVAVKASARVNAFVFVQLPLYQRVIGYQLVPAVTVSAGLQFRL